MKSFLINILLVGLLIIPALGGYVLYKIQDVRRQVEAFLNISLAKIQDVNTRLDFDLFQCDGIVKIECKSSRLDILKKDMLILSFSNITLSLKDFDSKSLSLDLSSSIRNIYGHKEEFSDILPRTLKTTTKFEFLKDQELWAKSVIKLDSKDLSYQFETISTMDIDPKKRGLLKFIQEANFKQEKVYLSAIDFLLKRKQGEFYSQKEQYTKLAGLLFVLSVLYQKQYGFSLGINDVFNGIIELFLGKKESLYVALKNQEKFCLNCGESDLERLHQFLRQQKIEVK